MLAEGVISVNPFTITRYHTRLSWHHECFIAEQLKREGSYMKKKPIDLPQVPVGIVVSVGKESSPAPRFSAYIWGPAPETKKETIKAA